MNTFRLPAQWTDPWPSSRSRSGAKPPPPIITRAPAETNGSQRPAPRLLALDRLEQRLEVALAEAPRPVPLDHLEEQRRPVGHRLGEDLQHVPLVVPVHEDAQLGQIL